ncbi:MAG: hypothetical protein JXB62_22205 [Pirellulales bacterium]|nr:hypothetical protein [Pirellulales bacterium]
MLPPETSAARLIVCERTGRWAAALRRQLDPSEVRLEETRTLGQCREALARAVASFLVAELTLCDIEPLLGQMARLPRDFPLARLAVVADRCLAGYEWLMREAGAVHFTCSTRRLGPLAQAVRRHLAQAPVPPQTLTQRIWASLPWKESAGTY